MTPENWTTIELKNLGMQRTETITPLDCPDTEFELWSVPSFPSGGPEYAKGKDIGSTKQKVQEGDVLLCKINPRINRVWVVGPDSGKPQIASTEWIVFRAHGIKPEFLMHRFREEHFRELLCANVSGVGGSLTRVRPQIVQNYKIAIAPINEQKRIVEKINSLQIHSRGANNALAAIPPLLEKFRQSVLYSAFRGDLTAAWRVQNPDIEHAEKLLERIRKERRKRWEEDELAKMKTKGQTPKDDNWKKKYKEPAPVDTTGLPELPEGWCWISLPECGEMSRGKSKHRPRNDPRLFGRNYPFIQTGEVSRAKGHIKNATTFYSEFGLQQSRLFPAGTVCITIAANIAETAVLDIAACFPDSVVGVIVDNRIISPDYLEFYVRTIRDDLAAFAPATAQKNINIAILNKVAVPIPPEKERLKIEYTLSHSLRHANNVENKYMELFAGLEKLDQSILAKAFRGELVPQDPNDEPASELLKRIKKEQDSMIAQKRTFKKKKTIKKTPSKTVAETNALEELILTEFPQNKFTFDDLRNKTAMQYDELKKADFFLLEEGVELTQGKKLALFFDKKTEVMHFQVRTS